MKFPSAFTAILVLVLASPLALAKPDCPGHPSCKDDDGGADKDLPANATFLAEFWAVDAILDDGLGVAAPYIDGQERVSAAVGRSGIFGLDTSNRITGPRKLCLSGYVNLGPYCNSFIPEDRCLVGAMRTNPTPARGGEDLRSLALGQVVTTGFFIHYRNNKQNFFAMFYDDVRVEAIDIDANGSPNKWRIDTDWPGLQSADVYRIEDNQYVDRVQCGADDTVRFDLPFHLEVELQ